MKFILSLLIFFNLSCSSTKNSFSVEILNVGTTGDYAPFSEWKDNQFQGIDIEMAKSLSAALGKKVVFVKTTWPSLMQDLKDNKFSIAMSGITVNEQRKKQALFSRSYVEFGKMGIARCEDKDKFKSLKEIDKPGIRVAVNPGGTNESFARANIKKAQIVTFKNNEKIFGYIIEGKADVMITDSVEVLYQSKLNKDKLCPTMSQPMTKSEIAILIKKDKTLKKKVDQ